MITEFNFLHEGGAGFFLTVTIFLTFLPTSVGWLQMYMDQIPLRKKWKNVAESCLLRLYWRSKILQVPGQLTELAEQFVYLL